MRMKSDKLYLATTWEWFLDNVSVQLGNICDCYIAEAGVSSVSFEPFAETDGGEPIGNAGTNVPHAQGAMQQSDAITMALQSALV